MLMTAYQYFGVENIVPSAAWSRVGGCSADARGGYIDEDFFVALEREYEEQKSLALFKSTEDGNKDRACPISGASRR